MGVSTSAFRSRVHSPFEGENSRKEGKSQQKSWLVARASKTVLRTASIVWVPHQSTPSGRSKGCRMTVVTFTLRSNQSTDKLRLPRQSFLRRQPGRLGRKDTAHPHTQASHTGSALSRYAGGNTFHRLGYILSRLSFLTLL